MTEGKVDLGIQNQIEYKDIFVTLDGEFNRITDNTTVGELKKLIGKMEELCGDIDYETGEGLSYYGNFKFTVRLPDMWGFYVITNYLECEFNSITIDYRMLYGEREREVCNMAKEGYDLYRRGKREEFDTLWKGIVDYIFYHYEVD